MLMLYAGNGHVLPSVSTRKFITARTAAVRAKSGYVTSQSSRIGAALGAAAAELADWVEERASAAPTRRDSNVNKAA